MEKIDREDIMITSKHSNRSKKQIESLLEKYIYAKPKDWKKFLDLFLLTLGLGFVVSGIVFFFAFNWAELNKFIKIGIILLLLAASIICAIQLRIKEIYKKMLITAAAMLVGVLFAVFGQIYQTGANAYDFFLAWTLFITLWVIITHFYPLWLLFIVLTNVTIVLFNEQVSNNFDSISLTTLLFFIDGLALIALLTLNKYDKADIPLWFRNTLALAVTTIATVGICFVIFDSKLQQGTLLICGTIAFYLYSIRYALSNKSTFFIGSIAFSLLIMINCIILEIYNDDIAFLIISILFIMGVTAVIKFLLNLQLKWTNGK
ncbi:DUF2157 domain-containing protein [Sphingobacterium faecium]|uniref:DUF2157 domain-containing protein n=1 Tax=Sphingobacterium faecium TaxID=34087 RepID=UPI00320B008B